MLSIDCTAKNKWINKYKFGLSRLFPDVLFALSSSLHCTKINLYLQFTHWNICCTSVFVCVCVPPLLNFVRIPPQNVFVYLKTHIVMSSLWFSYSKKAIFFSPHHAHTFAQSVHVELFSSSSFLKPPVALIGFAQMKGDTITQAMVNFTTCTWRSTFISYH